jgi:hypothetical protein
MVYFKVFFSRICLEGVWESTEFLGNDILYSSRYLYRYIPSGSQKSHCLRQLAVPDDLGKTETSVGQCKYSKPAL